MRFSGTVGYADSVETSPGVWEDDITERSYSGDIVRALGRLEPSSAVPPTLNDNVRVDNSVSIVGDAFAYKNFAQIRYVDWNGSRWTVTSVEIRHPRLILAIGGLWSGNSA